LYFRYPVKSFALPKIQISELVSDFKNWIFKFVVTTYPAVILSV